VVKVSLLSAPLAPASLPLSILNYVRRMRKHLVLDHASSETMFSSDSYVAQKKPKSVLCLPLLRQTELVGILYLENNLTTGAFTKDCLSVLELLASQAAISLENASLYSALAQENQDRRRAEQEVRKLNADLELRVLERTAQLQEANRELEAFSYSVSHDLRNPLRTIDGFSAALEEDHGERLEPDALDSLRRVRTAARWMSELIDNLLSLSRVTSGELRRETISMSAMVEEALADLRRASPDRKVECVVAPEVMVSADVRLLRIALDNLLGNAWKYTGKRTQARIEFGMREEEGQRVYYIRDNGAGFDMKFASKLFAPFQRMHTTEEFPGTGVGLATVQRIIRRHGGRIWVHTAIEEGATFSFTLQPEAELRK
jgi:light-regulated signal transduction histidine kinase (bacteriophytochrome)